MRSLTILALAAILTTAGCAGGLKQALGLDSENRSDNYVGIGGIVVIANGLPVPVTREEIANIVRIDVNSSGNQGADGAKAEDTTNTTSQETPITVDPKAVKDAVSPLPPLPVPPVPDGP